MKKLLNTLYITRESAYLSKEGENVVVLEEGKVIARYPIHILNSIVCFSYVGVSPALMKFCNENLLQLSFLSPEGRYCGQLIGEKNGNVLLRREQYKMADNESSLDFVRNIIYAKAFNSRKVLLRAIRDHKDKLNMVKMENDISALGSLMEDIKSSTNKDTIRGIEGSVAKIYFSCFDELIVQNKKDFVFETRSKRPPLNRVNALLSFLYTLLSLEVKSALESVGIDSFVGFFHTDRPGRASMALDMMEELRAYMVDRTALSMINLSVIGKVDFETKESSAVLLNDKGRAKVLDYWQNKKQTEIMHPFLKENIKLGLLPHVQAMLLNRYIRADLEAYPPFLMKG